MKKWVKAVFLPLVLGFLVSAPIDIGAKYAELIKPPLSPPSMLFPIVWTVLYLLMGIGSCMAYDSAGGDGRKEVLLPYAVQLFFNLLWTPVFFGARMYFAGSIISLLIIFFLVRTVMAFYRVNKTEAYLQIPYLVWSVFASYLSFAVYFLNR